MGVAHRPAPEHLDPETLGLYLEGRASALEREQVEWHLSRCADCYELFVDSSEALIGPSAADPGGAADSMSDSTERYASREGSTPYAPVASRSRFWLGLLPAAAAVVLITWVGLERLRPGPSETAEFQTLISAMADGRPAEGRLSGGVPYGPPPSTLRSGEAAGGPSPRVEAAAASVQSSLERDRSFEAQRALGVSHLAVGTIDRAITAFEAAAAADPGRASAHSDVAVAYLQRARSSRAEVDLTRALEAADRALTLDPGMPEALFNRALALERLGRGDDAIGAWKAYLAVDPRSEWAGEARQALASLETRPR
jgi:tetratricopeptide (TPR) repeat protein